MEATAKQVPRGPHLGRVGIGLGQKTSTEKAGDLQGVDSVVLGLGPVDGPHIEGVAKDEGDVVLGAEVGEPVPVEDALGTDDEIFPERLDGLEEDLAVAGKVPMEQDVAFGVLNAQIQGAGMQVDPAVMLMLAGEKVHGSPPGLDDWSHSHCASRWLGGPGGGLYQYHCCFRLRSLRSLRRARLANASRAGNLER